MPRRSPQDNAVVRRLTTWLQGLGHRTGGLLSPVNSAFMLLLGLLYLVHLVVWFIWDETVFGLLVLNPTQVLAGQFWRVVTAAFVLHDPMYLIGVLLGLFFFGRHVEDRLGSHGYTTFLMLAVVTINLLVLVSGWLYAFLPMLPAEVYVHGFAGVDLALLVAFATLMPTATIYILVFPVKAWILAVIIVFIDIVYLLFALKGAQQVGGINPMVPWSVLHLAGAAFGFLAIRSLPRLARILGRLRRRRQSRQAQHVVADVQEIDRLLEKVSLQGLPSLTAAERRFLERYSQRQRQQENR